MHKDKSQGPNTARYVRLLLEKMDGKPLHPLPTNNAAIINEYGWLWLNRDGSPSTITGDQWKFIMRMEPGKASNAERIVDVLIWTCSVSVERDSEALNANSCHRLPPFRRLTSNQRTPASGHAYQ